MSALWEKFKSLLPHLSWVLAAVIVAIDPSHIDNLVEKHPQWSGVIMALWAMVMAWAQKTKAPAEPTVYPPGTGVNPVTHQSPPKQGPYTGGLR